MTFVFSKRSRDNLIGVHPDLVKVMYKTLATSPIDFVVIEGMRSLARQKELFTTGKSQTMNSRHLQGKAVDFAAWIDGAISWELKYYTIISNWAKRAGHDLQVPIVWGGDWEHFKDSDHIELDRRAYPDEPELVA